MSSVSNSEILISTDGGKMKETWPKSILGSLNRWIGQGLESHKDIIERLKLKEHLKHFSDLDCESVMIVQKVSASLRKEENSKVWS